MLSNKMTFSLTILVMLLAIGFIVAPSGIAHEKKDLVLADGSKITFNPAHPKPTLSVASNYDLSSADGPQVMRPVGSDGTPANSISVLIDFSTPVTILEEPATNITAVVAANADSVDISDIVIAAYNEDGIPVTAPALNAEASASALTRGNPDNGKNAILVIAAAALTTAQWEMIDTLYISIPQTKFKNADRTLNVHEKDHAVNVASDVLIITLVGADDGDAKYFKPPYADADAISPTSTPGTDAGIATGGNGTPGVVSITKTLGASGFTQAEGGAFTVRIILTEEPKAFTAAHILVDGATATVGTPVMGLPIKEGELTHTIAGGGYTAINFLPDPTGRDNMYHQYRVMITPEAGFDGNLVVSVAQFEDMVSPISKKYVPLSKAQRLDTAVPGDAAVATSAVARRNARIMEGRELLTVRVHTITDANVAAATTAYEARQTVLDAVVNEAVLEKKRIVPAGGYFVLHLADLGDTGIESPKVKTKEKISAAQKLYNTAKIGLPFPANDLDNFFRNGGTLNLAYADITAATGSGHDESKGPTGDDATGYTAATTNAYTTGALIINEIMWGLDAGETKSQYIELHNPGTAAIGIDHLEWVLTVGAPPTGYTVIDTVSNNPASGYWQVPGNGGVTKVSETHDELKELVSMSRMMGADGTPAADGTAAASWAKSKRPSANLSGLRVGTPGAANVYDTSAQDAADAAAKAAADAAAKAAADAAASKASPATAADLMISEIMFVSNAGKLPQWIEITNTSTGEVSLVGWVLDIDNDPADADVAAPSLGIKLDEVTLLKAGQSALVVSKTTNRNSGVAARSKDDDNAGALDSNRIVDASDQIKPADTTYSMLSEMSFRISLQPPLPLAGGATVRGNVVGNLGGGWELPTSEAGRSSIIRHEMGKTGEVMGTDEAGWRLADKLTGAYVATYYGDKDDKGTPGYDAGGPLPVELSKFGAKRDPLTGQVIVTWETQSELNNAGFFIKRSQQKNAKFVAVNPTMIIGAGTTSEKQSYTYTDTTAKPNIVYYYQIEDVSLDGQRQTLTRAHRLKGHVGAAGKLTTLWGELKEQQ